MHAPRAGVPKRELWPFIFAPTVRAGSEDTPPMLKIVEKQDRREVGAELLLLDEIARAGARNIRLEDGRLCTLQN